MAPDHTDALYKLIFLYRLQCNWDAADELLPRVEQALRKHVDERGVALVWPFAVNILPFEPGLHDALAARLAEQVMQRAASVAAPFSHAPGPRERLTVGYVSADFRAHAVGGLVYQLFGHHDRSRVKVIGYSLLNSADIYQDTVRREVDLYRDLTAMTIGEAAALVHDDAPDILVDLSGYTEHARPELLALRPAPLQVSWTGYLNTMQAPYIDYLLADSVTMDGGLAERYSEAVIRLPGCFFPGSTLPVSPSPARADLGLPEEAFVYCSFNHSYKLDRELFDCWMQILRETGDSVLWLYAGGIPEVEERLRRAAESRGIDPDRLVFAPRVGIEDHVGRLARADLFLDSFVYNAGATAVSAAQAGLPLLTRTGDRFLSRMGTSINRALGLDELCVSTPAAYVERAVELAKQRDELDALKARIADESVRAGLFDLAARARVLERVYETLWRRYREDRPPEGFCIDMTPGRSIGT